MIKFSEYASIRDNLSGDSKPVSHIQQQSQSNLSPPNVYVAPSQDKLSFDPLKLTKPTFAKPRNNVLSASTDQHRTAKATVMPTIKAPNANNPYR